MGGCTITKTMTEKQIQKIVQMLVAFELLAESMQEFEKFDFFKEVKGNSYEVARVRAMAEKMLQKMFDSLPDSAQLESAQLPGAVMVYARILLDSYCTGRAQEFTSEASAMFSRYDKKSLKNNPDLFRAMFVDAGASSYPCFEKGIISALKMVATNG